MIGKIGGECQEREMLLGNRERGEVAPEMTELVA
jgi:hypothetical protein